MATLMVTQTIPASSALALYLGGFEEIGGIEASFEDLATALAGDAIDLSLFVWAKDLPQLRRLSALGIDVHRTRLRSGCRFDLPDWALYLAHGAKLARMDRIVFGKLPPEAVLRRMLATLATHTGGRPELLYVTAYRPVEMWPQGLPRLYHEAIDTILVQSAIFADDLRAMDYRGRIVEIPYLPPHAANPPVASRGKAAGTCRLAFLGRFVPQKNLFYLLDIVAQLKASDVELHLFGEGEHEDRLRAEAAERRLAVTFHGALARADVPAAIDRADIFVNPSLSEGQCLVALEVLSRGRPFFASLVGAIPAILARGRFGGALPLDDAAAAAAILDETIRTWRSGYWQPAMIADDYRKAYVPDVILDRYRAVLAPAVLG